MLLGRTQGSPLDRKFGMTSSFDDKMSFVSFVLFKILVYSYSAAIPWAIVVPMSVRK